MELNQKRNQKRRALGCHREGIFSKDMRKTKNSVTANIV